MSIKFTLRMNRLKQPRVEIYRAVEEEKNGKTIRINQMLGKLPGLDPLSIETFARDKELSEYETFTLENCAAQLNFNEQELDNAQGDYHREIIYFSKPYNEALFQLWQLSKKNNIPFCPAETIHRALINKAKSIERKLNEIKKEPLHILEKAGINIEKVDDEEYKKIARVTCRKLFRFLLNTGLSEETIANEFNEIATMRYQKKEVLKPHYIKDFATNIRKLPFWYNTVAIDLLLKHNKNPLEKLSIEAVAENWLRLRKESMKEEDAISDFKKIFQTKESDEPIVRSVIRKEYERGIPTHDK